MGSDIDRGNFGDSARNRSKCELHGIIRHTESTHVFDGAGENVHYHSDNESLASRKSKTRYINPAICIETVESTHSATSLQTDSSFIEDVTPHPHSTYRSNSTPFLTGRVSSASSGSVKRKSCRLVSHEVCCDEEAMSRENRTYREDGTDTFRLSVASVSTTTTAKEERQRNEKKRQEVFERWLARKEHEKREKARLEKMKLQVTASTTPEQREESFKKWLERKRTQTERRKAEEIMRQYRNNERLEQENKKRQRDKEEKLAEWIKKKEDDMKSMKTQAERKAARAAIEEERRRVQGERAYRDWLRTSKNKPLPVPLNQGELRVMTCSGFRQHEPLPRCRSDQSSELDSFSTSRIPFCRYARFGFSNVYKPGSMAVTNMIKRTWHNSTAFTKMQNCST